ncbi:MAG: FkbM family methyltransferase [Bacteroidales bacterium]|nr:FkbM family methyltransferase [Bacteroidales bacterium]MCF8403269.1 FkbM family methyltransferase [Bacteroidales bacterium]
MLKSIGKYYFQKKGFYPVKINGRKFKGDPFHIGFWRIVNKGGFEPEFYNLLDQALSKEMVYCDIGSWIGPTVVYASALCKQIYAFEPDPTAYPYLLQNIQTNKLDNITTHNIAIGNENGSIKMGSHGGQLGDSMTSMVNIGNVSNTIEVPARKWSTWLKENNYPVIDFLKIDIEGGEVELIPSMADYLKEVKPILHLSFHGPFLKKDDRDILLSSIFEVLEIYPKWYNEKGEEIKYEQRILERACTHFLSLYFRP